MENKDIAKAVIEAIGGRDNVSSVAHCATRLRVMLKLRLIKTELRILKRFRELSLTQVNIKLSLVLVQ